MSITTTRNEDQAQQDSYQSLLHWDFPDTLNVIQEAIWLYPPAFYISALRREIQEGFNVVENWNSATKFIHYGRHGEKR